MDIPSQPTPCPGGRCTNYRYGHMLHWLHADLAASQKFSWRPAIVSRIEGCELLLSHPRTGHSIVLWHHATLTDIVVVGQEVLVNEELSTLLVGGTIVNVQLTGTLGPVDVAELATPLAGYAIDLETGRGLGVLAE